jgi:hypothetical protein
MRDERKKEEFAIIGSTSRNHHVPGLKLTKNEFGNALVLAYQ